MTFNEFDKLAQEMISKVLAMGDSKGKEYAGTEKDRLKNFKDIAEECGLDPIQVWHCYYKKHIRAIDSYVRTGRVFSEPIEGRFVDAITYLLLGYGLIVEVTQKNVVDKPIPRRIWQCNKCNKEIIQSQAELPLERCPCGGTLTKYYSGGTQI